jgi:hypothetical protein
LFSIVTLVDVISVVIGNVATITVVVTIIDVAILVATSVTSIDYPIFTLQNKHRSKFSEQNFNLHSPCDEITPLVAMGTATTSCNFSRKTSLVLKLFHPKCFFYHSSQTILKHTQVVYVKK